jgi:hypothetical protein
VPALDSLIRSADIHSGAAPLGGVSASLMFACVLMLFGFAAATVPAFSSSDYFHRYHANVRFHACLRLVLTFR